MVRVIVPFALAWAKLIYRGVPCAYCVATGPVDDSDWRQLDKNLDCLTIVPGGAVGPRSLWKIT